MPRVSKLLRLSCSPESPGARITAGPFAAPPCGAGVGTCSNKLGGGGKMACWTADNTRTLIALVVTQLVLTFVIMAAVVTMAVYVTLGTQKVQSAATRIAGVTSDTAEELKSATRNVGGSASTLLGIAADSLQRFVGTAPRAPSSQASAGSAAGARHVSDGRSRTVVRQDEQER